MDITELTVHELQEKIKNKEKIDIIDEEDILNKIKSLNTGEKSEFDDLLEIGGE